MAEALLIFFVVPIVLPMALMFFISFLDWYLHRRQ